MEPLGVVAAGVGDDADALYPRLPLSTAQVRHVVYNPAIFWSHIGRSVWFESDLSLVESSALIRPPPLELSCHWNFFLINF